MDAASNLRSLHGLVAFVRCLALRLAEASRREFAEVLPQDLPHWMLKQNRYKASLRGFDADCIVDNRGTLRPLREMLRDLLDFCEPVATQIGEVHGLQIAKSMPDGRCGYEAQVDAYRETRSARAVVEMLRDTLSA